MIVRHHHDGKVYLIEVPPGSRIGRSEAAEESVIFVPAGEGEIPIFEEPPELLLHLAHSGRHGLRLLGVEDVQGS